MWKVAFSGGVVLMLGAMGCVADAPAMQKHRARGCPVGTMLAKDGRRCVLTAEEQCPAGFVFEEAREICFWPCADASVDAEASPFCTGDAGAMDAAE
jgi:hypothetical protein